VPEEPQNTAPRSANTFYSALRDEEQLRRTIDRLSASGVIDQAQAGRLRDCLDRVTAMTTYILGNLAAHLAIGASKAILPLPIGAFLRGSWVAGARASETLRGRTDRAQVHSLPVFLVSIVPAAGYLAYVVALRRHDPDAALLYANHLSFLRYDQPLDTVLAGKPAFIRRIVERAVGSGSAPSARPKAR